MKVFVDIVEGKPAYPLKEKKNTGNSVATVDHILPVSEGGQDEEDNYILSCSECNNQRACMDVMTFFMIKVGEITPENYTGFGLTTNDVDRFFVPKK